MTKIYVFKCHNCGKEIKVYDSEVRGNEERGHYFFCDSCIDEHSKPLKIKDLLTVIVKGKKNRKFIPTKDNCVVEIIPNHETEKAYAIEDGSNGLVGKHSKGYYKYIAKSICYIDKNGKIYAPIWA